MRMNDIVNLNAKYRLANVDYGANLDNVLLLAGLYNAYNKFNALAKQADLFFMQGDFRAASNVIYKIWADPHIIPALLLFECFYARCLVLPTWKDTKTFSLQLMPKKSGGTRPVVIPELSTRICMGAVNSILQTACNSWSDRSFGFRPGYGTHSAVQALAKAALPILQKHGCAYFVMFDISKAFNSVDMKHLARTLDLQVLPHDIKALLWMWQQNKAVLQNTTGLVQGFSYSPTLFAWYLDLILVEHTNFIAYADNFAGVFATQAEASQALEQARVLLHAAGLSIHPTSVTIDAAHTNLPKFNLCWLGHALELPSCQPILHKYEQIGTFTLPKYISALEWQTMLLSSDWVNKVHNIEWRSSVKGFEVV